MSQAASIALLIATLIVGSLIGSTITKATTPTVVTTPTTLVPVEIIEVWDSPAFLDPRTLVELEDGTRRILQNAYGTVGDTYMLEVH